MGRKYLLKVIKDNCDKYLVIGIITIGVTLGIIKGVMESQVKVTKPNKDDCHLQRIGQKSVAELGLKKTDYVIINSDKHKFYNENMIFVMHSSNDGEIIDSCFSKEDIINYLKDHKIKYEVKRKTTYVTDIYGSRQELVVE